MRAVDSRIVLRFWARMRSARERWSPIVAAWVQQWLLILQQTPAARWLAACPQTSAARWLVACPQTPACQWAWAHWRTMAEISLYVGAYLVYLFSRGLVYENVREVGIANGGLIAGLQRELGFLWEPGWQAWALEHVHGLVVFLNWAYILTYWPVILALAVVLFLRNRRKYYYYRTVVLLNLIAALLSFMLFPVASPFAIPGVGLEDTIQAFGPALYGSNTMAAFYNTTAAMPSLHFSWTVILGVYWWRSLPGGFKVFGAIYPAMTFFAITMTGNHFVLDAIVGGFLAGLCFGIVEGYRAAVARVTIEDVRAARAVFLRRMRQLQERTVRRMGRPTT